MRERFQRFMSGRYGVDELSRFLLGVTCHLMHPWYFSSQQHSKRPGVSCHHTDLFPYVFQEFFQAQSGK